MTRRTAAEPRLGFTLVELLVSMALIVLTMSVLSEAFVAGVETFRELKAIGDLNERLRAAVGDLRDDVRDSHFSTNRFIGDTLRAEAPSANAIAPLRARYRAIAADATDLDDRLTEVGRQTRNPLAKWLLARVLEYLEGVKTGANTMVALLDRVDRFVPNPP